MPWSFVAHDQLWNVIPTTSSVNYSKLNNLLSQQYFEDFVKVQHLGLRMSYQDLSENHWLKYIEPFLVDLKVNQAAHLLELDILIKAYKTTFAPLISLATFQGFTPNWVYIK